MPDSTCLSIRVLHGESSKLEHPCVAAPIQLRKHEVAQRIMLLTLPKRDRAYVRGSFTFNEIWSKLLAKYMPSKDAEARNM